MKTAAAAAADDAAGDAAAATSTTSTSATPSALSRHEASNHLVGLLSALSDCVSALDGSGRGRHDALLGQALSLSVWAVDEVIFFFPSLFSFSTSTSTSTSSSSFFQRRRRQQQQQKRSPPSHLSFSPYDANFKFLSHNKRGTEPLEGLQTDESKFYFIFRG